MNLQVASIIFSMISMLSVGNSQYSKQTNGDTSSRIAEASWLAKQGDWEKADKLFEEALSLEPNNSEYMFQWMELARTQMSEKESMVDRAQQWLVMNPKSSAAHLALVREAKRIGNEDLVNQAENRADRYFAKYDGEDVNFTCSLIQYLLMKGEQEAAKELQYSLDPNSVEFLMVQADFASTIQ